jgi:uncharacterized heparinase superfamily protein
MAFAGTMSRALRLMRKPPGYTVRRIAREASMEADRVLAPLAARRISAGWLVRAAGQPNLAALWQKLAERPYPLQTTTFDAAEFSTRFPQAKRKIMAAAERALAREIDLLGTGPTKLGMPIDWLRDVRTGDRWEPAFCRSIDYVNRGRPSDVKIPWEISRLQWLLPAGQAFRLTGEERFAAAARDIVDEWIAGNPYAWTVNWSCTMEPALRILGWTWLFHQFARSRAWADEGFRGRFLSALYLHGQFVEKHIERSSINGNHLTADAAGLVFAGLFFGSIGDAPRWAAAGWSELVREIERQVHPDGVDFEASVPYHRLVVELFLLPGRYRQAFALPIPSVYADRLRAMARFTSAYSRPDGSSPVWGDADDGRALPLGTQGLTDHRYLVGLIALAFDDPELMALPWGEGDEIAWHFGTAALARKRPDAPLTSQAFKDGGFYILRNARSHVFIDCGPVGLAGLGGHGHNDALAFEAWLDGVPLIVDRGSYVYTASFEERNAFRSTRAHSTLQVDGQEINRFYAPDNLWNLHEDARAACLAFTSSSDADQFVGLHHGYQRLADAVTIHRTVTLDHRSGLLTIRDEASGSGHHSLRLPFAISREVKPGALARRSVTLAAGSRSFLLEWDGDPAWKWTLEPTRLSPRYGVVLPSSRLVWTAEADLPLRLDISLRPVQGRRPE